MELEKTNGSNGRGGAPLPPIFPPFLQKCYDMVSDPATDDTVCWGDSENTFIIKDQHTFSRDLLPKYFKHSNISSFVRQLNTYGFRKIDHDKWVFKNDGFVKGQKDLLKTITRKKSSPHVSQQGKLPSSVKAIEVGHFSLVEEIERMKRDKNLLMQELVNVRQHQQNTDSEINDLRLRLQGMELNQQQMLSFLAMAVQSPTFLSQLVQQSMNNGRWRADLNKKKQRMLPALESGGLVESKSDRQIIKYEESLCEAAADAADTAVAAVAPEEGATGSDFSEYLEEILASPVPTLEGIDGQTEPLFFDIPDFIFDFDFPIQDVEMESSSSSSSQNTVLSDEILQ